MCQALLKALPFVSFVVALAPLQALAEPTARFADPAAATSAEASERRGSASSGTDLSAPPTPPASPDTRAASYAVQPAVAGGTCPRAELLVWRARRLRAEARVLQALTLYTRALNLEPTCGSALIELARLRTRLGDTAEAKRLYRLATRQRNIAAQAYKERAWLYHREGEREQALVDLKAALSLDPLDLEATRQLADWYIEIRAWSAALTQYRAVVRLLSERAASDELNAALVKVQALTLMAAETDPVLAGRQSDNWIRRSIGRIVTR